MGVDNASNSSSNHQALVSLNVYDLTPANHYTSWFGVGIFHSGIEVHGMEYGFGAHDLPVSGVFEVEPKSCPGFIFRNSIPLGHLDMPSTEFRRFIENLASEYHGDTYHLLSKNCNHFTDDVAWKLLGTHIPGWVNRLARLGTVCSCLLPESLQATTVKQLPEYHSRTDEGGSESVSGTSHESSESEDADQDHHLLSPSVESSDVAFIKEAQR